MATGTQSTNNANNNIWTRIKALLLCVFSIALMFLDHKTSFLIEFKQYTTAITYPLKKTAEAPNRFFSSGKHWIQDKNTLLKEIERLKKRELYLSYEIQKMASLTAENQRLRMLLKSSVRLNNPTITAKLINISSNPYRHIITLNQGGNEGVSVNQAVLSTEGVIGQIIEISPLYSKAILITDPQHSLPIEINRNGIRGIATGNGKLNLINIENIAIEDDVQIGDLLVTSGLGGRFPHGYPVAKIKSIEVDSTGYFAKITAVPTANLDRIREVLIILSEDNLYE